MNRVNLWMGLGAAGTAGAALCLLRSQYERKALSVEDTQIASPKIRRERTLVFLSDLHSNVFGQDNCRLLQAIVRQKPDAILIGGDMMVVKNRRAATRTALDLIRRLVGICPVYYGNGNHENRMVWERGDYGHAYEEYRDRLRRWGVIYLEDDTAPMGEDIEVSAVDLGQEYYEKRLFGRIHPMETGYLERKLGKTDPSQDKYRILLAHSPLYFPEYQRWGADLVLSGHFHGGTIRLPFLGGVMTPQYQFFLPWCAGEFQRGDSRMIVSRGMGTHSINIRLNNRPQLVVIRLKNQ